MSCGGFLLPPVCQLACPCNPDNSDSCDDSGKCACKEGFCGPRCADTTCTGNEAEILQNVAISVGAIAGFVLILGILFLIYRYRKKKGSEKQRAADLSAKHALKEVKVGGGSQTGTDPYESGNDERGDSEGDQSKLPPPPASMTTSSGGQHKSYKPSQVIEEDEDEDEAPPKPPPKPPAPAKTSPKSADPARQRLFDIPSSSSSVPPRPPVAAKPSPKTADPARQRLFDIPSSTSSGPPGGVKVILSQPLNSAPRTNDSSRQRVTDPYAPPSTRLFDLPPGSAPPPPPPTDRPQSISSSGSSSSRSGHGPGSQSPYRRRKHHHHHSQPSPKAIRPGQEIIAEALGLHAPGAVVSSTTSRSVQMHTESYAREIHTVSKQGGKPVVVSHNESHARYATEHHSPPRQHVTQDGDV